MMHLAKDMNGDGELRSLLQAAGKPLSAYDLLALLRDSPSGKFKAPVQVYRSLARLEKSGEVHRVAALNAFVICTCAHAGAPPGFLVCTDCGAVSEFDAKSVVRASGAAPHDLEITALNVEISGKCTSCQSAAKSH